MGKSCKKQDFFVLYGYIVMDSGSATLSRAPTTGTISFSQLQQLIVSPHAHFVSGLFLPNAV